MTTLADIMVPPGAEGFLRPINLQRDLVAVAELVELCFKDNLDPDGRSYLRQMRDHARSSQLFGWALSAAEAFTNLPLNGYVWEQDRKVVGNLSLIPMEHKGKRIFLIANVAVHPEYRGRGIARMLTTTAIEYCRRKGIESAWLQVRQDNLPALRVYTQLGFEEQARRTTWYSQAVPAAPLAAAGMSIEKCSPADWQQQRDWLDRLYPSELRWYLSVKQDALRPDWRGRLYRFFTLEYPTQWAARRGGKLLAVLSSLHEGGFAHTLWLAAPEAPTLDESAVEALLVEARGHLGWRRSVSLNLPADCAVGAIQRAGFHPHQTLIWMRVRFT